MDNRIIDLENVEPHSTNSSLGSSSYTNNNGISKRSIKIIGDLESLRQVNKKGSLLVYIGIPVFAIGSLILGISHTGYDLFIAYIGYVGFLFFGIGGLFYFYRNSKDGGEYVPFKSFKQWRLKDKEAFEQQYRKGIVFFVIFSVVTLIVALFSSETIEAITLVLISLGGTIPALRYYKKTITFHEDIDYSANQNIVDLIGIDVNEKVIASYQSFGSDKTVDDKDCIFIVTNYKVFLAYYKDKNWHHISRPLSEISEIGLTTTTRSNSNLSDTHIILHFYDNTTLSVLLDYEKTTTNAGLFVSKFLSVIDHFLLGKSMVSNNQRRRIVTSQHVNDSEVSSTSSNIRPIEISDNIINQIKNGVEDSVGRSIVL